MSVGVRAGSGPDDDGRRRYWLLDADHAVIGTITVDTWQRGWSCLGVSSLAVRPAARGAGVARQALESVYDAAVASGLNGAQLHTHWAWQPTVRWYLRREMWVTSWKHDLGLSRVRHLPPYEVTRVRQGFAFSVEEGGVREPLLIAGRKGDVLRLRQAEAYRRRARQGGRHDSTLFYAGTTFALHLALAGWPLVRGAAEWEAAPESSDIGQPEGLARKIQLFEESARRDGWSVCTPSLVLPAFD
ncbi:GNAT family N-acetyltransferase [Streptomyces sp. NPDC048623]|uniref:GNAT family N-acetyltransferase n=1 Tax=Streptomyces sp. NPDC048623 TaxID=3155761 RepID=UPI003443FADF